MIEIENIRKTAYYTAAEAAVLLGISRSTLRRRMTTGEITPVIDRRNRRIYYRGAELIRFVRTGIIGKEQTTNHNT